MQWAITSCICCSLDETLKYFAKMKEVCRNLTKHKWFELTIIAVILLNSLLIGVETYTDNSSIRMVQEVILWVFTIEIILRFIAAGSLKDFFTDGWNIFDLTLVVIGYIPEAVVTNVSMMMTLRILRVFRVLRLLRTAKEIKLIVTVLIRSFSAKECRDGSSIRMLNWL